MPSKVIKKINSNNTIVPDEVGKYGPLGKILSNSFKISNNQSKTEPYLSITWNSVPGASEYKIYKKFDPFIYFDRTQDKLVKHTELIWKGVPLCAYLGEENPGYSDYILCSKSSDRDSWKKLPYRRPPPYMKHSYLIYAYYDDAQGQKKFFAENEHPVESYLLSDNPEFVLEGVQTTLISGLYETGGFCSSKVCSLNVSDSINLTSNGLKNGTYTAKIEFKDVVVYDNQHNAMTYQVNPPNSSGGSLNVTY